MCYTYFELSSPVRTHSRSIVEHKDVGGIYSDTTLRSTCIMVEHMHVIHLGLK